MIVQIKIVSVSRTIYLSLVLQPDTLSGGGGGGQYNYWRWVLRTNEVTEVW